MSQANAEALAVRLDHGPLDAGPEGRTTSRRAWMRTLGLGSLVSAASARTARAVSPPPDVAGDIDPGSLLPKLVRRITQGVTEAEVALATSLGYAGYLEYHLNAGAIPENPALTAHLATLTSLTMQPVDLYTLNAGQVSNELVDACLWRSVYSTRQLFERMVEFWTDHFNIDVHNENDQYLKTVDDREVVRPNALGSFPNLLKASAHSPAMLYYLDNHVNRVGVPNENYARELMELHTLGVDGGYTQQDVVEVARCFTGWGLYGRSTDATTGLFRYKASDHDNAQKTVLGNVIAAGGGMQDGEKVLQILAEHPSTAKFIATKLCRWLVSETPSASLISGVAAAYTATGGDIKAMIRAALPPNVLAGAPPKYKRPFHVFVSALRTLPTTITATSSLRTRLNAAGHVPFYWSPPDGYPDRLDFWVGLVIARWNFGAALMANQISGVGIDAETFFSGITTAQAVVDKLNRVMFAGEMPASDRDRIRQYLLPDQPSTQRKNDSIGLAIGSPGFQWY